MSDKEATNLRLEINASREILNPTLQEIKDAIETLSAPDILPFLILGKGDDGMTYIQAMLLEDSSWTVEFQDGSVEEHFQAANISADKVTALFQAFARDDDSWRTSVEWEAIDIEEEEQA